MADTDPFADAFDRARATLRDEFGQTDPFATAHHPPEDIDTVNAASIAHSEAERQAKRYALGFDKESHHE